MKVDNSQEIQHLNVELSNDCQGFWYDIELYHTGELKSLHKDLLKGARVIEQIAEKEGWALDD